MIAEAQAVRQRPVERVYDCGERNRQRAGAGRERSCKEVPREESSVIRERNLRLSPEELLGDRI